MAADSRLTLNVPRALPGGKSGILSITTSDSAKKLFLAPNNVGISTCGPADIGGVPLAGFVESFIVERLNGKTMSPAEVSNEMKAYFRALNVRAGTVFHVAGYAQAAAGLEQTVFFVDPAADKMPQINPANGQGANWAGELDVLQRLLNDVALVKGGGQKPAPFPSFPVPFEFFTLQDAIDFAVYGIRSTIDTLRFQTREKTVGGPIDVLVVTPGGARWIAQKQLKVKNESVSAV